MPNIDVTICGLSELALHRQGGLTHVISILDPGSPRPAELDFCEPDHQLHLRFHDVIEDDPTGKTDPPEVLHVETILAFGRGLSPDRPARLLVHCHGGISRSTASTILLLAQRDPERDPDDIVAEVVRRRPQAWPNLRMIEMGDRLLGRDGALIEAAKRRYRALAITDPGFVAELRADGRLREVDA